jgi:SIR2-like domain
LIERLVDKQFSGIDYATVKWAFPTLVSQFDLVAYRLNDPQKFYSALYSALYDDPKFKDVRSIAKEIPKERADRTGWNRWKELLNSLQKNKTLTAVADLLIIDSEKPYSRNPKIHAVLTTNADNLLELYCQAKASGERLVTMVDRASVGDHPDATPVYHLHGTLDARGENFMRAPEPCSKVPTADRQEIDEQLFPSVVFRESEYFETLAAPANFVNHTPQSYFQRLNVLFIGTSLDDPNIRRWLYTSFRERVKERTKYLQEYYCRKHKDAVFEAELESVRHFWLRPTKEMHRDCSSGKESEREVPKELVECAMRKLGVQVVWCDGFRDVCIHLVLLKKEVP